MQPDPLLIPVISVLPNSLHLLKYKTIYLSLPSIFRLHALFNPIQSNPIQSFGDHLSIETALVEVMNNLPLLKLLIRSLLSSSVVVQQHVAPLINPP